MNHSPAFADSALLMVLMGLAAGNGGGLGSNLQGLAGLPYTGIKSQSWKVLNDGVSMTFGGGGWDAITVRIPSDIEYW